MKWISVEDRLPKKSNDVLTIRMDDISEYCHPYNSDDAQLICFFSSGKWWDSALPETVKEDNIVEDITHWMKLPKPPESV